MAYGFNNDKSKAEMPVPSVVQLAFDENTSNEAIGSNSYQIRMIDLSNVAPDLSKVIGIRGYEFVYTTAQKYLLIGSVQIKMYNNVPEVIVQIINNTSNTIYWSPKDSIIELVVLS